MTTNLSLNRDTIFTINRQWKGDEVAFKKANATPSTIYENTIFEDTLRSSIDPCLFKGVPNCKFSQTESSGTDVSEKEEQNKKNHVNSERRRRERNTARWGTLRSLCRASAVRSAGFIPDSKATVLRQAVYCIEELKEENKLLLQILNI